MDLEEKKENVYLSNPKCATSKKFPCYFIEMILPWLEKQPLCRKRHLVPMRSVKGWTVGGTSQREWASGHTQNQPEPLLQQCMAAKAWPGFPQIASSPTLSLTIASGPW
jgi:hypothetical protein